MVTQEKRPKTSCSRFFDISCPYNTSNGLFLGDASLTRFSWDRLVFDGRMLIIWVVLARGANCTNVHLARLPAGSLLFSNVVYWFLRQRPPSFVAVLMVSSEGGPAEPRSTDSKSWRRRDRDRRWAIFQAQAKRLCANTAPVAPTPRRCRRSDGPRSFMVHRIETERDCASGFGHWNGQYRVGGQWDGLGMEPCRGDDVRRKW